MAVHYLTFNFSATTVDFLVVHHATALLCRISLCVSLYALTYFNYSIIQNILNH